MLLAGLLFGLGTPPVWADQGPKVWVDSVYQDDIRTVRLHQQGNPRSYPIYPVGGSRLTLSFDKFSRDIVNYQYTIRHCNPEWEESDLSSQVYMAGMRSAYIDDYQHSRNTYHQYIHYTLEFPNADLKPKIPGNYVLIIFKNDNLSEPVLTRRFYVAADEVGISTSLKQASFPQYRDTHQEFDFSINHQGLPNVSDPFEQFEVIVRQNGRTDNALQGLNPRYIEGKTLIYDYQEKNLFKGGNEFRPLDIRSLNYGGQGVRKISLDSTFTAHLNVDESRGYQTYVNYNDNNGWNLTLAANRSSADLEASYISTYFYLNANPSLQAGESIYVYGGLSDWKIQERCKLQYLPDKGVFYTNMLLKQGYYDYKYAISEGPGSGDCNTQRLEGSHFETENQYLILVYFKDRFRNIFKLVGYRTVNDGISN